MPNPEPDYEYEVFFSYKRHPQSLEWTRQVTAKLRFFLSQELNLNEVRMFVDEEEIAPGEKWPLRLQSALRRSKCLVCVWSPMYFQSDWCNSEWQSFRERERLLGLGEFGLIAPLKYHDGEHFPAEARAVQWTDISPWTSTVPAFWQSARALDLEDRLKEFAVDVANIIRRAPEFRGDWPIVASKGTAVPNIELTKL
jgi:hypothetical protein